MAFDPQITHIIQNKDTTLKQTQHTNNKGHITHNEYNANTITSTNVN
jgi:hypothetical protein